MFKLFFRDCDIYAPISGRCINITECNDPMFSSKALGDGFVIIPDDNIVKAPCTGKITSIFPTKHAIGLTTNDQKEILLHIGIDTVKLKGQQFNSFVSVGDRVKKGDKLVTYDAEYMKDHAIDMSTIVILLNGDGCKYVMHHLGANIKSGEKIIEFESGD